jgi:hypothetical protein
MIPVGLLGGALKIRIITYVSGIAPSKKPIACNTAHVAHPMGKLRCHGIREINGLPVLGVRKNPFFEVTPECALLTSSVAAVAMARANRNFASRAR